MHNRKSQKKWLKKPENRDYFRSKENVERVREWRKSHPGYSRKRKPEATLQDDCIDIQPINQPVTPVEIEPYVGFGFFEPVL